MQINKAQLLDPFPICGGLNRAPLRAGGRANRWRQTHQLPRGLRGLRDGQGRGLLRQRSGIRVARASRAPTRFSEGPASWDTVSCGERPFPRPQAGQRAAGSAPSRDDGLRWPRPRCPSIVDVPSPRGQNNEQEAEPETPYTSA